MGIAERAHRDISAKPVVRPSRWGKSTRGQKAPEKNRQIFMEVVNGNPINRICELANVRPQTVYDKIDFFQEQCLKFLDDKERRLKAGFPIEKLYLSSDRQDYIVNWTHRKDKRTTQLSAVGTADNGSGYIFGMHPVGLEQNGLATKQINAPETVFGVPDEGKPRRSIVIEMRVVVLFKHAPDHIFIDV